MRRYYSKEVVRKGRADRQDCEEVGVGAVFFSRAGV